MVDATNRIVMPGFIDTHSHPIRASCATSCSNGLLDPDYNRDIQQRHLTPPYTPADVYAGVLIDARSA